MFSRIDGSFISNSHNNAMIAIVTIKSFKQSSLTNDGLHHKKDEDEETPKLVDENAAAVDGNVDDFTDAAGSFVAASS
jgi:hypothetical protein